MRAPALGLGLSLCVAAGDGIADHRNTFPELAPTVSNTHYTYADVVGVEPMVEYRTITEPRRECRVAGYAGGPRAHSQRYPERGDPYGYDHHERHHDHGSPVAAVIGGVVGGLLGSQFGSGSGKKAMTVAGALAGATIASGVSRSRSHQGGYTPRRCTTVMTSREVEEVSGYRVRYVYQGEEFSKVVTSDPGDRVRVQVEVTPAVGEPDW
ncbi:MAG: glycine zipper 2TM domain-containing protein [Pseudomonadales bacterium]|nr:glycine zipper 2TM domain-containing protein [Pseudomonadales bacterium]NIX08476.1 glycine zipper 2TM domain-containing protein [Pseudomonadales bacterium]